VDNQTTATDFADLAKQQAALAATLSNRSAPPEGFDAARVGVAARMLLAKRRRAAANAWPAFADAIGGGFASLFNDYARSNPMTAGMTPHGDALRFAQHLAALNQLPEPAVRLVAIAESRTLIPMRRGPFVSLRIPLLGVMVLRLPWR
jgi:hypothetical protein